MGDYDADLAYFPHEYVPNVQGSSYHPKWVKAHPSEASKWATFRDAVLALKAEYGEVQPTPPSMSTKYGKALVASGKEHMSISRVVGQMKNPNPTPPTQPPPTPGVDALTYTPPHYVSGDPRLITSYSGLTLAPSPTFAANSGYTYTLNNSVDYFLDLGLKEWNAYNFGAGNTPRTELKINGGRDVVIVGGEILFHSTNIYDDCAGLHVVGGDTTGTVYVEGVKITSVNGVTWSSGRDGVFQHCYISARTYQDKDNTGAGGDGNHPDVFQIWTGSDQASIYMDRITGYTWYTGFTCLEAQPIRWRRNRTDLHSGTRIWESQQMGNYMNYLSPGADPVTCFYDGGTNNWMDLGYWGGIREQLQMAIDSPGWTTHLTYIVNHLGQDYGPTNNPNFFRGGQVSVGATQGDEWRCTSNANISERWKWGISTDYLNGEYAPAAACGVSYVPVGYA